ncbi:MAG TPA: hypothetical protein VN638_08680 [Nitrospiraceae bacterium]|nr:hypothetical protein [Nitrospiraceae bacterium]
MEDCLLKIMESGKRFTRAHGPWWLADTSGVDRRQGYDYLAAKLTYFIRRA